MQDENLNDEQKRKKELEEFDEELKHMRKKLQHIENLSMFQRQESSTHHQKLMEMNTRIRKIEINIESTHRFHIVARENNAQQTPKNPMQSGRNAKQVSDYQFLFIS